MTKLTNCLNNEEAGESYSSRSSKPKFLNKQTLDAKASEPSEKKQNKPLRRAIDKHRAHEQVSFHTPGHKGRAKSIFEQEDDVTELAGLDDLADPCDVLAKLSTKARFVWNTQSSHISVNGASAGLIASILSVGSRGRKILVPRNAHRSVISGLVLSGLEPIWYSPKWNSEWGLYDETLTSTLKDSISKHSSDLAAVVVVSPTYAGALTDIAPIASLCHQSGTALIVDEAHGAHLSATSRTRSTNNSSRSGIKCGADIVIHSLHKTLGALTQTGIIHLPAGSLVNASDLTNNLNMVQSSSPSYLFLLSIEQALLDFDPASGATSPGVNQCADDSNLEKTNNLAKTLVERLRLLKNLSIYDTACGVDLWHILIRPENRTALELHDYLSGEGIYPECCLGNGVLLMLGVGTTSADIDLLIDALSRFCDAAKSSQLESTCQPKSESNCVRLATPIELEQIMTPRAASMAPSHLVPVSQAENLIASECIAPCPPGIPVCVPGQRLTKEVLNRTSKKHVRVIKDSIK